MDNFWNNLKNFWNFDFDSNITIILSVIISILYIIINILLFILAYKGGIEYYKTGKIWKIIIAVLFGGFILPGIIAWFAYNSAKRKRRKNRRK